MPIGAEYVWSLASITSTATSSSTGVLYDIDEILQVKSVIFVAFIIHPWISNGIMPSRGITDAFGNSFWNAWWFNSEGHFLGNWNFTQRTEKSYRFFHFVSHSLGG